MQRTLFKNAALLDVNHKSEPGFRILVEDGDILAVEGGNVEAESDSVVDVAGKTLMPGLIDVHVHLGIPTMTFAQMAHYPPSYFAIHAAEMAELMLQQGFTTIQDACGVDCGLVKSIAEDLTVGPRIFFAHSLTCIPRGLPRFLIGKFENLGFHI